jgi:hypothetical protein
MRIIREKGFASRMTTGCARGRQRSLLGKMSKTKPRNRVKGSASRGFASRGFFRRWKWVWITLVVLLLIPAMQVAVVRFVDPPRTVPMWIDQVSSSGAKAPLRYRWIPLPQIPEMFLEHLWISEDQRFFRVKRLRLTRSHHFILTGCSMFTCCGRRATRASTLASQPTCAPG